MKNRFLLSLLLASISTPFIAEEEKPTVYSFTNKVVFTKEGDGDITNFAAFMPVPQTNDYQTVWKVEASEGVVLEDENYGNKLLYVNHDRFASSSLELSTTTHITPIKITWNMRDIRNFKEYDPESKECRLYLGNREGYIDTSNIDMSGLAGSIWKASRDVVDYAYRCYEYVASHYQYLDGDWRPLVRILSDGGGGSADFSTLMVNLLRCKGIPARHNVCVTFGEQLHTFVDFYLEGIGWIPLDAARKSLDPDGNYFGVYDGSCIVLIQDIGYKVSVDTPSPINILQDYVFYCTPSDDGTSLMAMGFLQNNGLSGIHAVTTDSVPASTDSIYNLQGQKVPPTYKGLVIRNGQKYIQK